MTTLTILPSATSIAVAEGDSLLAAMLASGAPVAHKCDGEASCGQCHLFVIEGRKGLSRISRAENDILDTIVGVGSKSRLACQATLTGTEDVTVEVLSFV
ncbi:MULTISPECIES: 2Fe-2S iron-sulfur cluster-binding protein [Novosphingobium]|uniref:2Fe-2S iron-sulfur cluster binding domain-containing protein n=1 Tax=Novosphingobium decolorationis TaxID=2698673 RepID=A0ABX8E4A9_9SPHN|nr:MULTISPECIES: 2Fe-2S iron-sulfur cluster-binding protein [Novosphingobium]MED5546827.1 2Fe-2S iron-sulfur cluster-binding protein [Pseudomonadota bacterium]QVM83758.1 2Fe-2S iron-sulfur cluster binding domain-containing protein [Novosphingobium decolorationis]GAM05300.1 2Fe-2S ferredoxin [Novosphingobium sp. MBES04]